MKTSALLGLAALLLYVVTPSRHYTPDTMAFARLAAQGPQPDSLFFQAEHLLYPTLPWLVHRALAAAGIALGPLEALQLFNAVAGAVGVAAFHHLLLNLGLSRVRALAGALLLAGSYAYWYHATEGEDQIAANALIFLAAASLASGACTPSRRWPRALAPGALVALGVLLHGTAVLFAPAALWLSWRRLGLRASALLCLVLGLVLAATYAVVGFVAHGITSLEGFLAWSLAAPKAGVWGIPSLTNLWIGLKGLARALLAVAGEPRVRDLVTGEMGAAGSVLLFGLATVALILLPALGIREALRRGQPQGTRVVTFALLWALPYGLFNIYWAPEDIQFWAGILPAIILLALESAPALATLPWSTQAGLAAAALPLALNGALVMLPRSDAAANRELAIARCVAQNTTAQDLIVAPGWDWAGSYLPYFGQRQVWSLLDHAVLQARRDPQRLLELGREAIARVQSQGGQAFLVRLPSLTAEDAAFFRRVSGLSPEEVDWPRRPAVHCDGETLWLLGPAPHPQN